MYLTVFSFVSPVVGAWVLFGTSLLCGCYLPYGFFYKVARMPFLKKNLSAHPGHHDLLWIPSDTHINVCTE